MADVLLRDGKGMDFLMRRAGVPSGMNMNGTDLIPQILRRAKGSPVAIYGTADPWLSTAKETLEREGHDIVDHRDGFCADADYVALAKDSPARIIVLAMGMPKQERVAAMIREVRADRPCTIICGGAIVDFIAGRHPRAPLWMRERGLEWAFRLGREPRRLFSRYVIGNVQFLLRAQQLAPRLVRKTGTS
ncbi:WecB/TagA/CpsF family glycosyltransferase [Palleronia marisminoris]|uniref:WecB/TagA/CpsF family glycosyltransferase n=1 Tax=Palleronia marisminoris TaxID=315423 RepID=UPI001586FEA6|nr:WecB/TagA/CpsF family glycosyltransferase [Palleronia marisminoris]